MQGREKRDQTSVIVFLFLNFFMRLVKTTVKNHVNISPEIHMMHELQGSLEMIYPHEDDFVTSDEYKQHLQKHPGHTIGF